MPYVPTPSGARYHYELYGGGEEKVLFVAGFACCKGYWKATVAHLLNRGRSQSTRSVAPSSPPTHLPTSSSAPFLAPPPALALSPPPPPPLPHPPSPPPPSLSPLTPPPPSSTPTAIRSASSTLAASARRPSAASHASAPPPWPSTSLAILCHLGWVQPYPHSPYMPLAPATSPLSAGRGGSPPTLHIVSWSLGGMICQELSFLLLSPASALSHSLTSLVFTSSSPGGYRDPDEAALTYFWRNQPPWSGFKKILPRLPRPLYPRPPRVAPQAALRRRVSGRALRGGVATAGRGGGGVHHW